MSYVYKWKKILRCSLLQQVLKACMRASVNYAFCGSILQPYAEKNKWPAYVAFKVCTKQNSTKPTGQNTPYPSIITGFIFLMEL